MVLQRQEIYFISWSKCLSLQLEEQLLLNVLWAWDEAAKQKSLIRTYNSFQHKNHSKKGTPLSQQTSKLSRPRTSFIYKQRVRVPPSSTSRGRWPVLTWKIAKVQVCFVLNSGTMSPGFMNLSDGHNRNRVWNMLGKRVWSDKGGHLKLSNHVNCWTLERHVVNKNSNHKKPVCPQD